MGRTTSFITRIHSHIRSHRMAPIIGEKYPTPVPHKEYIRFPRTPLPAPLQLPMTLCEAVRLRKSHSGNHDKHALPLKDLGTLIGNAIGMRDANRRLYPSGGALYPIETYLIGDVLEHHPSGVFHYHPTTHALEFLWPTSPTFDINSLLLSKHAPASFLIVFTSVWGRSSVKYGDLAYSHGLMESAHMAQNISLLATALSIGTRLIAGFDDQAISTLLELDNQMEQPVYTILIYA